MNYEYKIEELIPLVANLTKKYTSFESTSITFEKAEQFMDAILYCIHESEQSENSSDVVFSEISAQEAYEIGLNLVNIKTKKALKLYNNLLNDFLYYENLCLYETIIKGFPHFFKWYDINFCPQNTILTLDYPILKDLSNYSGVDKIYEYLKCIYLEKTFLKKFQEYYIINILSKNNLDHKKMVENICEIVLEEIIKFILINKSLSEQRWTEKDFIKIQTILQKDTILNLTKKLKKSSAEFFEKNYENGSILYSYLEGSINGIVLRLKNSVENRKLI